jgi:hypothetical protein
MVFEPIKWFRSWRHGFCVRGFVEMGRPLTQMDVTQITAMDVTQITANYCGSVHNIS